MSSPTPEIRAEVPAMYAAMEESHWWFRGRRAILLRLLERYLEPASRDIVDIGCGTGGMLPFLGRYGRARGFERDRELIAYGRSFGRDIREIDFPREVPSEPVDVATMFDVLEHLPDDRAGLDAAARLVKPGGLLVLSVPALPWLWSPHDEAVGHYRRYDRDVLRNRLAAAGFRVLHLTHFNTFLLPLAVAARILRREQGHDVRLPPRPLNAAFAAIFRMEGALAAGPGLGIGVSLAAVALRR